jgi:GntR family transcriptional regulator, transcriptional repressor for pyruvate dehydrogenase complex
MTKADQIARKLLALVQTDVFQIGSRLPSERKLSLQLATSRNTLRSAIKKLEAMGILELRGGSGCYVQSKDDSIQKWQEIRKSTSDESIHSRLEASSLLEPLVGGLAADRIKPVDIEDLENCIVTLSKAIMDGHIEAVAVEATRFRAIMARSTGNRVLMLMMRQLDPAHAMACQVIGKLDEKEKERFFADHVEILNALKKHDAGRVKDMVAAHLGRMGRCLVKHTGMDTPDSR